MSEKNWIRNGAATLLGCLAISSAIPAAAAKDPGVDGVWRSRGYGFIAVVKDGKPTIYDVTSSFCLKRPPMPEATDRLFAKAQLAADGRSLTTLATWAMTTLYFEKLAQLPPSCTTMPANLKEPAYNFDVLWETLNEHYAFFRERGIDWDAIRAEYRPKFAAATTDAEFVELVRVLYRQFQDLHVQLTLDDAQIVSGAPEIFLRWIGEPAKGPGQRVPKPVEYLTPSWNRYLDSKSIQMAPRNVAVGSAAGGTIGYVMIPSESGEVEDRVKDFDKIFAGLAGKRGLILDMRINTGGSDEIALALAGLLTPADRPGYSKCARDGAGYTPVQRTVVQHRPNAFTGPVVLLTSSMNWSSGENFAMIVKDFPNVIVVGDRTGSVHSDAIPKVLPNGGGITMSNEVFTAPDGTIYESVGVPPDVLVAYEPDQVKNTGIDPQIEKALHLLQSGRFAALAEGARRGPGKGRKSPCA